MSSPNIEGQSDPDLCTHGVFFPIEGSVQFEGLKKLTVEQIRKRYPRFEGTCCLCGFYGIGYASLAHFVYGDY